MPRSTTIGSSSSSSASSTSTYSRKGASSCKPHHRSATTTSCVPHNNNMTVGVPAMIAMGFLLGCILSTSLLLGFHVVDRLDDQAKRSHAVAAVAAVAGGGPMASSSSQRQMMLMNNNNNNDNDDDGIRVLVAIAAFDFAQLPHLEEVLDGYADVALMAGIAHVHIVIHATLAYPITLIDLWNSRYSHLFSVPEDDDDDNDQQGTATTSTAEKKKNPTTTTMIEPRKDLRFSITIQLIHPSVRLHLVDEHRGLFYRHLEDYDLFIYTEDDIRITPRTVATYLAETQRIQDRVSAAAAAAASSSSSSLKIQASDYNVGIVRYEYNFPSNVIMDDKTRHATQNVTRAYWEHSSLHPTIPKAIDRIPYSQALSPNNNNNNNHDDAADYVHMTNHHQGMFLATSSLLRAWKDRCQFDIVTNRPGNGGQPTEGTQRVWMSSQQLYGKRHCHVQQVLPITNKFGALTVWHLPNKNYRRVGKFRKRTFSDGTEVFETPPELVTALELHIQLYKTFRLKLVQQQQQQQTQQPPKYQGVVFMKDNQLNRQAGWGRELQSKLGTRQQYLDMIDRRMDDFYAYVQRGGLLTESDLDKTILVDISNTRG